ncbi:hypothetical protein FGO68_gene16335 [Halteria grandinella]|uniref:Transmembrane protein n=1 Tax=Halteria grandinella TaxID=5974 RepID=A0A8J8T200_HALGN|nr:hypothetical protein FGO68_gene16335 [Halteria grandinella]
MRKRFLHWCNRLLSAISISKYAPSLSYKGKESYSTWQGGALSIFQYLITIGIVVSVLQTPFKRMNYSLQESRLQFNETQFINKTLDELISSDLFSLLYFPSPFYLADKDEIKQNKCFVKLSISKYTTNNDIKSLVNHTFQIFVDSDEQIYCKVDLGKYSWIDLFKELDSETRSEYGMLLTSSDQFLLTPYAFINSTTQEIWLYNYLADITAKEGAKLSLSQSPVIQSENNEAVFKYQVIDFIETNDIYGKYEGFFQEIMDCIGLNNKYTQRYLLSGEGWLIKDFFTPYHKAGLKVISFIFQTQVKQYERFPSSLVDALSRLGGILAIVNFSFIISLVNEKLFKQSIKENLFSKAKILPTPAHHSNTSLDHINVTEFSNFKINDSTKPPPKQHGVSHQVKPEDIFSYEMFIQMQKRFMSIQKKENLKLEGIGENPQHGDYTKQHSHGPVECVSISEHQALIDRVDALNQLVKAQQKQIEQLMASK